MNSQPTPLERLRRSGVRPDRALGQNFLIDPNILKLTERSSELGPDDIALEVGPGVGVLTALLVEKCAAVHCIEIDARLVDLLKSEFAAYPGFQLHVADAMRFDLSTLDPQPDKFVANLPYSVAAPLIIKSFDKLTDLRLWCLMVQKEIADRLFAPTDSDNYGGISVITRLMAEKISSRTISASVFFPKPRVSSSLLTFKRQSQPGYIAENFAQVKQLVYAMFSHRRKTLVNSLSESGAAGSVLAAWKHKEIRGLAEDLLCRLHVSVNIRAQALEPQRIEELARMIIEEANHD